jgi:membrane protein required for colicin V production
VGILVLLAGFTKVPQDPWWRESLFLHHFQAMALEVSGLLPDEVAKSIAY